jgi:hypothetical protein
LNLEDTDQSANTWLQEQLSKPNNPDASKLLTEIELIRLKGEPLYRLPSFQQALFQSVLAQRQATYDSAVASDWEQIRNRYQATGDFYLDMGTYKLYPVVLSPSGTLDTKFATAPTPDRGKCRSFDITEEGNAKQTQAQLNRDNPYSSFSIGHLRATVWDLGCYGKAPEELYGGFKLLVAQQLEDFKAQHGGSLTRSLILQAPSGILLHVGADTLLMGYRIEFPKAEQRAKGKGLLGKLTNLAVGIMAMANYDDEASQTERKKPFREGQSSSGNGGNEAL